MDNEKKKNREKAIRTYGTLGVIILAIILILGWGILIGNILISSNNKKNNEENKEEKNEEENKEENIFIDITDNLDENIRLDEESLFINNKPVLIIDPIELEINKIYHVEDNYLIITIGSSLRTKHIYLYNSEGDLLQHIYELDTNKMVIGSSDKYSKISFLNNVIELYGTRLIDGPSLVIDDGGEEKSLFICDERQIGMANVDDNYVVVAKYQLIYSNNKFEIKKIEGSEQTLGEYKINCKLKS